METSILIRPIKQQDNERVKEIIQSSLKEYGLDIPGTAYYDPQLNDLYSFYKQGENFCYWVLEVEGKIAGGIGMAPFYGEDNVKENNVGELQKFYIAKDYRGKGFSKELIKQAVSFGKKYFSAIYIETSDVLETANKVYLRYGFQALTHPLQGSEHSAMNRWYLLKE